VPQCPIAGDANVDKGQEAAARDLSGGRRAMLEWTDAGNDCEETGLSGATEDEFL